MYEDSIRTKDEKAFYRKAEMRNKWNQFKYNAEAVVIHTWEWIKDHKEVVGIIATAAPIVARTIKAVQPTKAQKEDNYRKNHYYDASTQTWWRLTRNISEETRRQIRLEQKDGRNLEDILRERGLHRRER